MTTEELAGERYIALTTFKRDGTPVSTPVWVVGEDGRLLVWTAADSWKAKRIRRDPHVRVAGSSAGGEPHGEALEATAAILDDTERVQALLRVKYGFTYRLVRGFNAALRALRRRAPAPSVTLVITPR